MSRCVCCSKIYPPGWKEELKGLLIIAWPIAVTQFLQFLVVFVSQSFCGHLGKVALDGVSLATSIVNVTGMCIMLGLSSAVDTLFSQTFGSANKQEVGVILQKGIWIFMLACLPCWAVFLNTEHLLRAMGQEHDVARVAGIYSTIFMSGLPGYGLSILLSKYLQSQSIVLPSMFIGVIVNLTNAGLHAIAIYILHLGVSGAAIAVALTQWCCVIAHITYIYFSGVYKPTWNGWSKKSLNEWKTFVHLAIPGLCMVCLEFWGFEIIVFLSGWLGKTDLAANTIAYNLEGLVYMIPFGLSVAASVRIGIHLGANEPERAMISSRMAISSGGLFALFNVVVFLSLRDYLPRIFTGNADVIELTSKLMLELSVFKVFDTMQAVVSGILRGLGFQVFGAVFNFIGYYIIALPTAVSLMLATPLRVPGAWLGMCIGCGAICIIFFIRILLTDWKKEAEKAQERAGLQVPDGTDINGVELKETGYLIESDTNSSYNKKERLSDQELKTFSYKSIEPTVIEEPTQNGNIGPKNSKEEDFNEKISSGLSKPIFVFTLIVVFVSSIVLRVYLDYTIKQ